MFDYVIVGAGSAGCVLANRLTEDGKNRVLLLEAGEHDRRWEIRVPAAFCKLFKSSFDWNYETVPQTQMGGRRLYWPRGKGLGGSSSMNAMIYIRGHRSDYDHWKSLGNRGWGFDDVLPYFKKAETNTFGASDYHGSDGPLHVSNLRTVNPLSQVFVEAATTVGLRTLRDFNGEADEGAGFYQVTQKNGCRCSAAVAYLKPALARPNLTVRTGAHVSKILFEGKSATGVAFTDKAKPQKATAQKEVILCGGTINSPQLLMLSGVGPAQHLSDFGISPIVDLPGVGQNLQDHLAAGITYVCTKPISMATANGIGPFLRYLLLKRGPLTSNVAEGGAFWRSSADLPPDLQFHFAPGYFISHGFVCPEGHGFSLGPTVLHPKSVGQIRLQSTDPLKAPAIDPNYLADERDLLLLVEGIKLARRIATAKSFDPYRGAAYDPPSTVRSDEEIAEFVRANAETLYHPAGTCKMGNDPQAVVDEQLFVHGLERLRVVDGSIMPTVVGGNLNAPIIMIAEKAADLIKRDHEPQRTQRAQRQTTG